LLDLIAAAQSDDTKRFASYLHALAHATVNPTLGSTARALGAALNEHDLRLPLPRRNSLLAVAATV
jgi:hypothetical protein